ncbi:hypothetical protein N8642_03300 [bacterium]|nr:hypothetical protein [bacterium]
MGSNVTDDEGLGSGSYSCILGPAMHRPRQTLLAGIRWIDSRWYLPPSLLFIVFATTGSLWSAALAVAAFYFIFPKRLFRLNAFAGRLSAKERNRRLRFMYLRWLLFITSMSTILFRHSAATFGALTATLGAGGLCVVAAIRCEILESKSPARHSTTPQPQITR